MKARELIDNFTATILAVIVHVVLLGILVLSLDWSKPGAPPSGKVEPVKAVVVDESQVADELAQIKKREEDQRKAEEKRARDLEREAQKAREQRREEEKRLNEVQRQLAEEKRQHDIATRADQEEAAKALAEVKIQKQKELEELQKLKRAETDLEQRRIADEAALATLAAQNQALAEEKQKIEEAKQRAEAERKRVEEQARKAKAAQEAEQQRIAAVAAAAAAEEARKKAEAEKKRLAEEKRKQEEAAKLKAEEDRKRAEEEKRRKQEEADLRQQMAREQALLDAERDQLRQRNLAEYIGQIQATVNRNWIRPTGTAKGLKCMVKVAQIPGGQVVRVVITQSSGNVAFDRSVENAVLRSSPLPQPKDPSLFEREIDFVFEPEG